MTSAKQDRGKLEEMEALFLKDAGANKVLPVVASLWTRMHPEDRIKMVYTHWRYDQTTTWIPSSSPSLTPLAFALC